jgi:hypothetical protein
MRVTELDPMCDEIMRGSCGCRSPAERFIHEPNSVVSRSGDVFVSCFGGGICRRSPLPHLSFCVTGDWQHAVYTNYFSAAGSGSAAFNYTANLLQRETKLQFRFTPAYDMPTGWGDVRLFATYSYFGLRYSDIGNTQPLPQYYTLDAGVVADLGDSFEVRVQDSNLTDQIGLTESNARVLTSGVVNGFEMARPIFGREAQLQLQLRYKF